MTDDITTDATERATETMAEQLEYEVVGAWRAGYDFLHLYDHGMLGWIDTDADFSTSIAVIPSNDLDWPHEVGEYTYSMTYELDDLTREEVTRHWGGE